MVRGAVPAGGGEAGVSAGAGGDTWDSSCQVCRGWLFGFADGIETFASAK